MPLITFTLFFGFDWERGPEEFKALEEMIKQQILATKL